jgi:hypothetical protein
MTTPRGYGYRENNDEYELSHQEANIMNGTFGPIREYEINERMTTFQREAAQHRLLAQASRAPRTTTAVTVTRIISTLAARVIRRQHEASPTPDTPPAVSGERIHIVTS